MKSKYIGLPILLLFAELYIGLFIHDAYVRPYFGDVLIAILIYCIVKSFTNFNILKTAIGVLLYCYVVEVTQYFHLIVWLGLNNSLTAALLLGSQFSWIDMLCYTFGIGIVIAFESFKMSTGRYFLNDENSNNKF
jgi:hypothetical protein